MDTVGLAEADDDDGEDGDRLLVCFVVIFPLL